MEKSLISGPLERLWAPPPQTLNRGMASLWLGLFSREADLAGDDRRSGTAQTCCRP